MKKMQKNVFFLVFLLCFGYIGDCRSYVRRYIRMFCQIGQVCVSNVCVFNVCGFVQSVSSQTFGRICVNNFFGGAEL